MLVLKNLRKEYKNVTAVDNISFSIEKGKIFGLLGPNGAGKTTTIRMILNIIKPTEGEILYNGSPINETFFRSVGYLPEERGLYKKSKVIDIINYLGELKGLSKQEALISGAFWMEKLEIAPNKNSKLEELSKGNQQKVQFIAAVLHDPEALILDEPFSGFDPLNQQIIKDIIVDFARNGKIIILSTHQMDVAEKLCNQIFLINKGKEVLSGSLFDIRKKYGSNSILIEFDDDPSKIKGIAGITHSDIFSNYAEVQIDNGISAMDFIKKAADCVNLKGFSIIEPTLNKIFIEEIKKDSAN
jgi:ABC-2 type transport system ATP-binding protein